MMLQSGAALGTTFLQGTLAGVFVGSAMMEHAARRLPAPEWIAYNHAKGTVYGPAMPLFFGATLAAAVAAALILPAHAIQSAAAALLILAGIVTKGVSLPLNDVFERWDAASCPDDWAGLRARWQAWNLVRCAFAVAAFAATCWAVIASPPS